MMAILSALCACRDHNHVRLVPAIGDPAADAGAAADAGVTAEAPDSRDATPPLLGIGDGENVATGDAPLTDIRARGVDSMLQTYCGGCHSVTGEGGPEDILDIPGLIDGGYIVPGSSAASPLMLRILDGSMPPAGSIKPTSGDVAVLEAFIDDSSTDLPRCGALPFLTDDEAYAAMRADVAARPAAERPFVRYLGIQYASNAGWCGPLLEQQRQGLFKAINSVSTNPAISLPEAIDARGLIYRIDIRRYGFDHELDLDGNGSADFADGWSAIVDGAGPYAAARSGPDADEVRHETTAEVPFLPVNAFVRATNAGDLYYALLGQRANHYDSEPGASAYLRTSVDDAVYAAFNVPALDDFSNSPNTVRRVTRVEQEGAAQRAYWSLALWDANDIFDYPLGFGDVPGQVIYNLPNGLQAYAVMSSDGVRLGEIAEGCVGFCSRPERLNAVACHACHSRGLLPAVDETRDRVEASSNLYPSDIFDAVEATYPRPEELAALMASDSAIHLAALAQMGIDVDAPDPISRVSFQLDLEPVYLERAAGELGVTATTLRENLGRLGLPLSDLAPPFASIERASFEASFLQNLCTLHAADRNPIAGCP